MAAAGTAARKVWQCRGNKFDSDARRHNSSSPLIGKSSIHFARGWHRFLPGLGQWMSHSRSLLLLLLPHLLVTSHCGGLLVGKLSSSSSSTALPWADTGQLSVRLKGRENNKRKKRCISLYPKRRCARATTARRMWWVWFFYPCLQRLPTLAIKPGLKRHKSSWPMPICCSSLFVWHCEVSTQTRQSSSLLQRPVLAETPINRCCCCCFSSISIHRCFFFFLLLWIGSTWMHSTWLDPSCAVQPWQHCMFIVPTT